MTDIAATDSNEGDSHVRRPAKPQPHRIGLAAGLVTLAAALLFWCASAGAEVVHPFQEVFGSAAQPSFGSAGGLAVDESDGDVLVIDAVAATVSRWNPDGTPAEFSALGTNVIDGRDGSGGKPCAE
jgi:hypothetical protein